MGSMILNEDKPPTSPEFLVVSLEAERAEVEQIAKRLRDAAANGRRGLAAMSQSKHTEELRRNIGRKLIDFERCAEALDIDRQTGLAEHAKFLNRAVLVLLLALVGVGLGWASERGDTNRLSRLLNAMPEVCKQVTVPD
jgi:hypothetical protein